MRVPEQGAGDDGGPRWHRVVPIAAGYALVCVSVAGVLTTVEPVLVSGGSMAPSLDHGDIALVRRGTAARVGDVALLEQPGHSPVLHRVTAVEAGGRLRTAGDANPVPDRESVSPRDVRGVVVSRLRLGLAMAGWRALTRSDTLSAQSNSTRQ